jgi:hypothetical protein
MMSIRLTLGEMLAGHWSPATHRTPCPAADDVTDRVRLELRGRPQRPDCGLVDQLARSKVPDEVEAATESQ